MKNTNKKLIVIFSIAIAIFTIGLVNKEFQNDTFFNISVGKYILENGIDMKEHFSWIDNLSYTYSHWAFDLCIYLIYLLSGFDGIYFFTIIFSIIIAVTLFVLISKRNNSPIISFFVTLITIYCIPLVFSARSYLISFFCFITQIYCIEEFIDTNKKKYCIFLIILSIIIANFHAASWPLFLILFMPYILSGTLEFFSFKYIYSLLIKNKEKKIEKLPDNSPKIEVYKKDIEDYKKIIDEPKSQYYDYKVIRRKNYNLKNLVILFIIISFTGLLTPIHNVPYTYIIKSMFGHSNFEDGSKSIDYIAEMQPIIPASSIALITFIILFIAFLTFLPTKIKSEHGFLILGLSIMTIISRRYVYFLVLLGAYVLSDLITQSVNLTIKDDIQLIEKIFCSKIRYFYWYIGFNIFYITFFFKSYYRFKKSKLRK